MLISFFCLTFSQQCTSDLLSLHCKIPKPSLTFEKSELPNSSTSKYQYTTKTLQNDLDDVILHNKNGKIFNLNHSLLIQNLNYYYENVNESLFHFSILTIQYFIILIAALEDDILADE